MMKNLRASHWLLAGLLLYGPAIAAQRPNEQAPVMRTTPGTPFVLDFSGAPDGGVSAGSFNNIAFSLNLREPVRKLVIRRTERLPDVVPTNDYADCTPGQESLLESQVRDLPRGDAAFVDRIDVDVLRFPQKDLKVDASVCYGVRAAQGAWRWRLTKVPLTLDPVTNRLHAQLWVKEANVDAIKLVFDGGMPRHYLRSITVTTQPLPDDRPR